MPDLTITDHPDRARILDEVHARPIEIIPPACRLRRLVFVMPQSASAMTSAFARFAAFCAEAGVAVPAADARQHVFATPTRSVTWEFHTEFVTITWISTLADWDNLPDDIGLAAIGDGQLLGATRLDVTADDTIPERLISGFSLPSLCLTAIEGGKAQVATDFITDASKFGRLEFAAGGLTELRRSIVARRLLEIETYRTMALLGLPLAQSHTAEVHGLELELGAVMDEMAVTGDTAGNRDALARLRGLSLRSGQLAERLSFRFAACQAYGDILRGRLAGLHEIPAAQGSSLSTYISNRVEPALRTCAALEKRLAVLAQKIDRAVGLLDVTVGLDLQAQNAAVLNTIAQTARSQLILQRTVEGLSTIAIVYYLLGILSYALDAWLKQLHFEKGLVFSIIAPIALVVVALVLRRLRKDPHAH